MYIYIYIYIYIFMVIKAKNQSDFRLFESCLFLSTFPIPFSFPLPGNINQHFNELSKQMLS